MPYGTPADPVAGTIITVAYAVANLLDPIRALRSFTGGADPPGTGYVVTSDSVSATTWKTFLAAMDSALGARAAKTTGDTFTSDIRVQRSIAPTTGFILWGNGGNYIGFDGTTLVFNGLPVWYDTKVISAVLQFATAVGNKIALYSTGATPNAGLSIQSGAAILYRNSGIEWFIADDPAGTNARKIWHEGNDGAGSGLKADIGTGEITETMLATDSVTAAKIAAGAVGASEIADASITDAEVAAANKDGAAGTASLRTLGAGAAQAAAGNHTHASMAKIAIVEYSGNGSSPRSINTGITPVFVCIQKLTAQGMVFAINHDGVLLETGTPGAVLTGWGFSGTNITVTGGYNTSGVNYRAVVIGT